MRLQQLAAIVALLVALPATAAAQELYSVRSYGENITVITVNRGLLTRIDDGLWLLKLNNANLIARWVEAVKHTLEDLNAYNLTGRVEGAIEIIVVRDGETAEAMLAGVIRGEDLSAVETALVKSGGRAVRMTVTRDGLLRLDLVMSDSINYTLLAEKLAGLAKRYRVVVLEVFNVENMTRLILYTYYYNLSRIPCFTNVSTTLFGTLVWFDLDCLERTAAAKRVDLNTLIDQILDYMRRIRRDVNQFNRFDNIVVAIAPLHAKQLEERPSPSVEATGNMVPANTTAGTLGSRQAPSPATSLWVYTLLGLAAVATAAWLAARRR